MRAKHIVDLLLEGGADDITPDEIFRSTLTVFDYMRKTNGVYSWEHPVEIEGRVNPSSLYFYVSDVASGVPQYSAPGYVRYMGLALKTPPFANGAGASFTQIFILNVSRPGKEIEPATVDKITRLFHKIEDLTATKWKSTNHLTKYAHHLLALPGIELQ